LSSTPHKFHTHHQRSNAAAEQDLDRHYTGSSGSHGQAACAYAAAGQSGARFVVGATSLGENFAPLYWHSEVCSEPCGKNMDTHARTHKRLLVLLCITVAFSTPQELAGVA